MWTYFFRADSKKENCSIEEAVCLFIWMDAVKSHSTPKPKGPTSLSSPRQLTVCIPHHACVLSRFSCVRLLGLQPTRFLCPWGFSRQGYWSGLHCPPPESSQIQGSNLRVLCLLNWQAGSVPTITTWEACTLHRCGVFSGVLFPFCFFLPVFLALLETLVIYYLPVLVT